MHCRLTFCVAVLAAAFQHVAVAGTYRFETLSVPDSPNTHAYAINDEGVVVGAYMDAGYLYHAYSWTSTNGYRMLKPEHPYNGRRDELAFGINSQGNVAGVVREELRPKLAIYGNVNGTLIAEQPSFTRYIEPRDITDDDQFLGYLTDDDGYTRSILWRTGTEPTFIDFPQRPTAMALGINNIGVVVAATEDSQRNLHAFAYDLASETLQEITYPGATSTIAEEINDSNAVVGFASIEEESKDTFEFGFVRNSNGGFQRIDIPGARRTLVLGINNGRDIVGVYEIPGQFGYKSFVGWYVPEPPAASLFAVGLSLAVILASRRTA